MYKVKMGTYKKEDLNLAEAYRQRIVERRHSLSESLQNLDKMSAQNSRG
jgi:hypothetical protein